MLNLGRAFPVWHAVRTLYYTCVARVDSVTAAESFTDVHLLVSDSTDDINYGQVIISFSRFQNSILRIRTTIADNDIGRVVVTGCEQEGFKVAIQFNFNMLYPLDSGLQNLKRRIESLYNTANNVQSFLDTTLPTIKELHYSNVE